jgi:drug/metabolite transporter (DMT)-like permease
LSRHPHFRAYLALAAVCFFWGTTYLGIRMSLESFPPLLLVCARYVISGSLMLAVIALRVLVACWCWASATAAWSSRHTGRPIS